MSQRRLNKLSVFPEASVGFAAAILIGVVRLYRLTLSPFLGQHCRFTPSCSVYMIESLTTHGFFKGAYFGLRRLLRCQPWCKGGHDPVPPQSTSHLSQRPS